MRGPPALASLFDGIGGFPLAAVLNGIEPVWASEIEKFPMEVTKIRFPGMRHAGDITKLNGAELPPVDIVTGGSPCQDLSVAGKRAGLEGERSGLFMEQVRVVKEMRDADRLRGRAAEFVRPRFMVWENVPGAFSSGEPQGEDFRVVLEETCRVADGTVPVPRPPGGVWQPAGAILGDKFSLAWRVLDAQYWGVPQRRKRIFLVADFGGHTAPQILFEQDRLFGHLTPGEGAEQGAAAPVGGGIESSGGDCLTPGDVQSRRVFTEDAVWPALYSGNGGGNRCVATAFACNQRDEVRDLKDVAAAVCATSTIKQQTFVAYTGCLTPWDTQQERIFTEEGVAPTLAGADGGGGRNPGGLVFAAGVVSKGDCFLTPESHTSLTSGGGQAGQGYPCVLTPGTDSVLCLNDQGGQRMDLSHGISGTLRAQDSHQPLVLEPDSYCIAGNIVDRQVHNGGNHLGIQENISYTLNTCDRHSVFCRQRVDVFKEDDVASTQSARQHKDATDLVVGPNLIRRLTPLECERLQGLPDGWTAIPGCSDSVRYKALGNSVAIPCVAFVLRGIAYFLCKMDN